MPLPLAYEPVQRDCRFRRSGLTTPHASLWASSEREVGSHVLRVRHAGERPQQLRSLSRQHGVEVWVGTATADERRRNRRCMADAFSAD